MLYSIMQTFAIPGTISLSLLSGALYGSTRGFLLVAAVSTAGSCSCYGMSCLLWRPIARAVWADRIEGFKSEVAKRRHDLLSYIIFLRVTPMLPNVFINVASPIVGVPLLDFALGECTVSSAAAVGRVLDKLALQLQLHRCHRGKVACRHGSSNRGYWGGCRRMLACWEKMLAVEHPRCWYSKAVWQLTGHCVPMYSATTCAACTCLLAATVNMEFSVPMNVSLLSNAIKQCSTRAGVCGACCSVLLCLLVLPCMLCCRYSDWLCAQQLHGSACRRPPV